MRIPNLWLAGLLVSSLVPSLTWGASVTMTWDVVTDSGPIEGYIVQRKTSTTPYAEIGRVPRPPYTDAQMPQAPQVCYVVKAFNPQAMSGPSNELCISSVLQAPTLLRVVLPGTPSASLRKVTRSRK